VTAGVALEVAGDVEVEGTVEVAAAAEAAAEEVAAAEGEEVTVEVTVAVTVGVTVDEPGRAVGENTNGGGEGGGPFCVLLRPCCNLPLCRRARRLLGTPQGAWRTPLWCPPWWPLCPRKTSRTAATSPLVAFCLQRRRRSVRH